MIESNSARQSASDQDAQDCCDATATCCAQFYEQDLVQELMGGSYHPGGVNLSSTLIEKLGLKQGLQVLDVACGVGTTSRMMANQFGLNVTGLCSPVELNQSEPVDPGTATFLQGSADALPFADQTFDGLTCECAVSTFANQPKVATEFARVVKPGGMFGMTDMVVNGELPADFSEKVAPWTCMAKALTAEGYKELFVKSGFEFVEFQDCSHTLLELATDMKRKLVMAGMGKAIGALPSMSSAMGMSLSEMRKLLATSTDLVKAGTIQYGLILFRAVGE